MRANLDTLGAATLIAAVLVGAIGTGLSAREP
jgi:hypothetical protein